MREVDRPVERSPETLESLMNVHALAREWQAEGARLRERYGLEEMAKLCETHASELLDAVREADDEPLTLAQAATESGYSARRLREFVAEGSIPNAGERGRPRIRRGDLPKKPGATSAGGFDAQQEARRVLGAS